MKILVTGGAGFIGSALIRYLLSETDVEVVNLDKLTYAATPESLAGIADDPRYRFERLDICDAKGVAQAFARHRPDAVMHLAAESHVDRSIDNPAAFVETNVVGTCTMLDAALAFWRGLDAPARARFRFHHISTDEVFGSLAAGDEAFREDTAYAPNSPYAASKAASDHFVRAWHRTYGLPVVISNCSNNYGPFQFPEKLIPLIVINACGWDSLPVYGTGENLRDWLYVDDHARALWLVVSRGRVGETYTIGGNAEIANLTVVQEICDLVDARLPPPAGQSRRALITFVADRPGHDLRYAMDSGKIERELGWRPVESFATGLARTVEWYLANRDWWRRLRETTYDGGRLGLARAGKRR